MKDKRNKDEKLKLQSDLLNDFARKYARKAQAGMDPNDRSYDRKMEQKMRRMKPDELDKILRNES